MAQSPTSPDRSAVATTEAVPLSRPDLTEAERRAVADVMQSPRLAFGPQLDAFESHMAERCGTAHAVAVSSGTAALHCIVRGLGIEAGDEVITTPYSFVASSNAILFEDARPRFVDIDPTTYNIDVAQVEAAITERTRAILAVDVFGCPANWPALTALAEAHDLLLIADACEAIGASIDDRPIGSWGHAASFGFYPNKQITTGEGGCITTDDADLARACRSLRNQGRADDGQMRHVRLGYNYRLDELSAALGRVQLERLDEILARRAAVAAAYHEALAPLKEHLVLPTTPPGRTRSWFVYVVRLREDVGGAPIRDQVLASLREARIGCAPYFPAIHLQPYYRDRFGFQRGDFPVCESVADRTFALPFFGGMTNAQVHRVADVLGEVLSSLSSSSVHQVGE